MGRWRKNNYSLPPLIIWPGDIQVDKTVYKIMIFRNITKFKSFHKTSTIAHSKHNMSTEQVIRNIFIKSIESVSSKSIFADTEVQKLLINADSNVEEHLSKKCKQYHVIGLGKAVIGMAVQIQKLPKFKNISGIVSVPKGTAEKFKDYDEMKLSPESRIQVKEGAENNLPDEDAEQTAKEIKRLAGRMTSEDILFVLISGGGSALLPLPIPPITLVEKCDLIKNLANRGATIQELNTVRINLSDIKGGKLAYHARNAHKIISLIISDIVGDPLELIASGPTAPFRFDKHAVLTIIKKFDLLDTLPSSILEVLSRHSEPPVIPQANIFNHIIGSNSIAIERARQEAIAAGYTPIILSSAIEGSVQDLSIFYSKLCETVMKFKNSFISEDDFRQNFNCMQPTFQIKPTFVNEIIDSVRNGNQTICVIGGGEPTVNITGSGKGGRNQELPLRISHELSKSQHKSLFENVLFLSGGTDGIDGPTIAAGAIGGLAITTSYAESSGTQNSMQDFINNNDSFNFYKNLNNGNYHLVTGHTGTNVMDLHLLILH